ncbi:MAG: hypothetical protein ACQESA_02960 [Patescibacteria group bacterium]
METKSARCRYCKERLEVNFTSNDLKKGEQEIFCPNCGYLLKIPVEKTREVTVIAPSFKFSAAR